jgi:hypothetical protein
MAAGVVVNVVIGVNIVVDTAITIIIGIVVIRVVTRVFRSSLLLSHRHNFMVRHHGFTQVCSQPP